MHFHSSHFPFHSIDRARGVCGSCWDIRGTQGGIRLAQIAVSRMAPLKNALPVSDLDRSYIGTRPIATLVEAA